MICRAYVDNITDIYTANRVELAISKISWSALTVHICALTKLQYQ